MPPQIGEEPDPRIIARPRRVIDHLSPSSGIGDIIWKVPEGQRYVVEHSEKEVPEGQRVTGRAANRPTIWEQLVRRSAVHAHASYPTSRTLTTPPTVACGVAFEAARVWRLPPLMSTYRHRHAISTAHAHVSLTLLPLIGHALFAITLHDRTRSSSNVASCFAGCPPAWRALELVFWCPLARLSQVATEMCSLVRLLSTRVDRWRASGV